MANVLVGKNFTPPDIRGKVTGRAKYAEDFRADGMRPRFSKKVWARLSVVASSSCSTANSSGGSR